MSFKLTVYTGGDLATNGYLWPSAHGVLAFDAPEGFATEIARQQLKVEALILTHGHFDHIWDAAAIQAQHHCPVYIHPADAPMLRDPSVFRRFGIPDLPAVTNCQEIIIPEKGSSTWTVSDQTFSLFHIPGHSPGSVVFYSAEQGIAIGGDVLFAGGVGRWDLPGGSQAELISGIHQHLLSLPDAVKIYPGHGPAARIGRERISNPYLA